MPEEQIIVENTEDLINSIKERGEIGEIKIAIDGWMGTGKTETARALSKKFELEHIECDIYWKEHSRQYAENMEYKELTSIVEKNNKICIEGICIDDITNKLGLDIDCKIYMKKLNRFGEWREGELLDYEKDVSTIIEQEDKENKKFMEIFEEKDREILEKQWEGKEATGRDILEQLLQYHFDYKPEETADIVFIWQEKDTTDKS